MVIGSWSLSVLMLMHELLVVFSLLYPIEHEWWNSLVGIWWPAKVNSPQRNWQLINISSKTFTDSPHASRVKCYSSQFPRRCLIMAMLKHMQCLQTSANCWENHLYANNRKCWIPSVLRSITPLLPKQQTFINMVPPVRVSQTATRLIQAVIEANAVTTTAQMM